MNKMLFLTATTLFLASSLAWAAPKIEITLTAEVEIKEVVDGKDVVNRIPATEAGPGQTIFYTLTYRNNGDEKATNVNLNDPIPKETSLLIDTVFGEGAAVTFSIDGGNTYNKPTLLKYRIERSDGTFEDLVATPDQYSDIQWVLDIVPAGSSRTVGFKSLVK